MYFFIGIRPMVIDLALRIRNEGAGYQIGSLFVRV